MALKFLSNHSPSSGSSTNVKHFDIRLNEDYVIFRGGEHEAASAQLAGNLVLCLTDSLSIQHVKLTLSGIVHMTYVTSSTSAMSGRRTASREQTFFEKSWTFSDAGKGKALSLPSDNYEWPFDVVLDGSLPESVEGLHGHYVIYRLKAEIARRRGKDIVIRKPLRIVRTIGSTALELSHAMSVENVWPNKIEYSISTPSKAVVFGSFLQVDFKLVPLLKGLIVGNVATQLKEEQEFILDPEWHVSALNGGMHKEDRVIAYDNYTVKPEDEQVLDEAAEGFQFSRYLELPKTLNKCLQDCNVKGIKIRHKIKFNVQLHNPDGHVSELRANLPVQLYISPSLPLNANNDLIDQSPQAGRAAVEHDLLHSAPPLYGEHRLDQIYSDVDLSGYRTPGPALSASATPYAHSRNISSDNLASLGALASSGGSGSGTGPEQVSVAALQRRLQDLRTSDRTFPHHQSTQQPHDDADQPRSGCLSRRNSQPPNDYFSPHESSEYSSQRSPDGPGAHSEPASHCASSDISRQNSQEDQPASGTRTPYAIASDHFEDLAKVPSYSTAVRTPAPRRDGALEGLPSYGAVMHDSSASVLTAPPSAHVRGLPRPHPNSHERRISASRTFGFVSDETRRLERLRVRGQ